MVNLKKDDCTAVQNVKYNNLLKISKKFPVKMCRQNSNRQKNLVEQLSTTFIRATVVATRKHRDQCAL